MQPWQLGSNVPLGTAGGGGGGEAQKSPCPAGLMRGGVEGKFLFSNGRGRRRSAHLSSRASQQKGVGISRSAGGERGWHGAQPLGTGSFLCCRDLGDAAGNLGTCKFYVVPGQVSLPLAHPPEGRFSHAGAAALWRPFGVLQIRDE